MNEFSATAIILCCFLIISLFVHFAVYKAKRLVTLIILSILYVVGVFYYFRLIGHLDHLFYIHGTYIEFGSYGMALLFWYFVCTVLAVLNLVIAILRRRNKRATKNTTQ